MKTFRQIVDFAVWADHRVKIIEKGDKYSDLAREHKKKQWNLKMTEIPIVIGVLGMIPKGLVRELEELEIEGQI